MKKHYVTEDKVYKNHTGITTMSILFNIAQPVFLFLLWIVCRLFKIEGTFHWFPLVASGVFYLIAGFLVSHSTHYSESRFLQKKTLTGHPSIEGKVQRWYFCDPIGKTKAEILQILEVRFSENNYLKKGRIRLAISVGIGLVVCVVAVFANKLCLNALMTYPLMILITLLSYGPSADDYLDAVFPQATYISAINWPDCICPNCGALCDPSATVVSDKRHSSTLGSYTSTSTDKYTDGQTTIYVEREEVRPSVHTSSSWKENHQCLRCGKTFFKKNGYSTVDRY